VPFEIAHGTGWVDPNGLNDYQGHAPGGTVTIYDALGRVIATQDPLLNLNKVPGIACSATLSGNYTSCSNYSTGTVAGDKNNYTYASVTSIDPNKHVSISYNDALGRSVYQQFDSGLYGGTLTLNEQKTIQYNVLNEPISVLVVDEAPQTGQTITSVTTTAQYDDLGRLTQVVDPDRGTHTYTLDPNGNVLTDVSGSRTIGYNYDLLGRVGCVQENTPTINATGACSAGNIYVQNTYDSNKLTVSGTTDYPKGELTQSVSKTYLTGTPGGDTVTTTESYEHDARGRLQAEQMQFGTLPTSWGIVAPGLPSYLAQYTYNDANQPTTTATSTTPSGQGYNTTQIYDSTGAVFGLSNQANASTANLATVVYNARAQLDTINYQTSQGNPLASERFGYDASGTRVLRRTTTGSGTTMRVYAFGLEQHTYAANGSHTSDLYYYSLAGTLLGYLDTSSNTTGFYLTDKSAVKYVCFTYHFQYNEIY
jgi:YD repeat-containing protein